MSYGSAAAVTRRVRVSRNKYAFLRPVDPDDRFQVAKHFGIAPALAAEIVYFNDERGHTWGDQDIPGVGRRWSRIPETPEARWTRMRAWVAEQIIESPPAEDAKIPMLLTRENCPRATHAFDFQIFGASGTDSDTGHVKKKMKKSLRAGVPGEESASPGTTAKESHS